MNYRSLSLDELTGTLCNEPDRDRFIEAGKELTRRIINGDFMSKMDHDAKLEEAVDEAINTAESEVTSNCRQEALEILAANKNWLLHDGFQDDWKQFRELMGQIGQREENNGWAHFGGSGLFYA